MNQSRTVKRPRFFCDKNDFRSLATRSAATRAPEVVLS